VARELEEALVVMAGGISTTSDSTWVVTGAGMKLAGKQGGRLTS
jgi:hypothetical protein